MRKIVVFKNEHLFDVVIIADLKEVVKRVFKKTPCHFNTEAVI